MAIVGWLGENWQNLVAGVAGLMAALTALFLFIPGEQPEKTFKAIGDFLEKFSAKPKP